MYGAHTWGALVRRLARATQNDRIEWVAAPTQNNVRAALLTSSGFTGQSRLLSATAGSALYELSIPEHFGTIELRVWEQKEGSFKQLATLTTSDTLLTSDPKLEQELRALASVVQERVESEEEIVSRLLDELDGL